MDENLDQNEVELSEELEQEDNITSAEVNDIDAITQELANLKDLYVRSQAEIQNIHRRTQEEVKKTREFAIANFAKDVVIIKDYLEMALADNSDDVTIIKTGVDLTLKQTIQIFERNLIREINPQPHDTLDPNLHQAVNVTQQDGFEVNTVVRVMQKGYILNSRILRPAMVEVAS